MKTKLVTIGVGILVVFFISCKSTTEVDKKENITEKTFDTTGYTSGTIVYSKREGDCAYTIQVKGGQFYDPINMDEAYTDFKKDGEKVWFKFGVLRMANRCTKANPISIIDMKARS